MGGEPDAADLRVKIHVVGDHRHARHRAALLDTDRRQELPREREEGADRRRTVDRHLVAVIPRGIAERDAAVHVDFAVGEATFETHLNVDVEVFAIEQRTDSVIRRVLALRGDRQRWCTRKELVDDEFQGAGGALVAGLHQLEPHVAGEPEQPTTGGEAAPDALVGHDRVLVARPRHEAVGQGDADRAVEDGEPVDVDLIGTGLRQREHRGVSRGHRDRIDRRGAWLAGFERRIGLRCGRVFGDDRVDRVDVDRARGGSGRDDAARHGDRSDDVADGAGPGIERRGHRQWRRRPRGDAGAAGRFGDVTRGGEVHRTRRRGDPPDGERARRLGEGHAEFSFGVDLPAAHGDHERTDHAELEAAGDLHRVASPAGQFQFEDLSVGELVADDVRPQDRDRLGDPADGPVLGDERDIGPAHVHGAADADGRIPGTAGLEHVDSRLAEHRDRVQTEIRAYAVDLGRGERVAPGGIEGREGGERRPVRADRAREEILGGGEHPGRMVEHLLRGRRHAIGEAQRLRRAGHPLLVRVRPELEPAVEYDAVALERPVEHVL